MTDAIPEVTTEMLQAFAEAWNRHDVDALMSFMTDDCVFESSAGPDVCGTRFVGRESVRAGFAEVWATFPDAHWGNARHFVNGERGASEWTFTGTRADGTRVDVHGCDLFCSVRRFLSILLRNFLQTFSTHRFHIDRRRKGDQSLVSADVRCRFFPANVLFAGR